MRKFKRVLTKPVDRSIRRFDRLRAGQIRRSLKACGEDTSLLETVVVYSPERCEIGSHTLIVGPCAIYAEGEVSIGSHVYIAAHCVLSSVTHPTDPDDRRTGRLLFAPVRIEDGAWLGAGAIVLPGVTVGRNAIVGAGASSRETCRPARRLWACQRDKPPARSLSFRSVDCPRER